MFAEVKWRVKFYGKGNRVQFNSRWLWPCTLSITLIIRQRDCCKCSNRRTLNVMPITLRPRCQFPFTVVDGDLSYAHMHKFLSTMQCRCELIGGNVDWMSIVKKWNEQTNGRFLFDSYNIRSWTAIGQLVDLLKKCTQTVICWLTNSRARTTTTLATSWLGRGYGDLIMEVAEHVVRRSIISSASHEYFSIANMKIWIEISIFDSLTITVEVVPREGAVLWQYMFCNFTIIPFIDFALESRRCVREWKVGVL